MSLSLSVWLSYSLSVCLSLSFPSPPALQLLVYLHITLSTYMRLLSLNSSPRINFPPLSFTTLPPPSLKNCTLTFQNNISRFFFIPLLQGNLTRHEVFPRIYKCNLPHPVNLEFTFHELKSKFLPCPFKKCPQKDHTPGVENAAYFSKPTYIERISSAFYLLIR